MQQDTFIAFKPGEGYSDEFLKKVQALSQKNMKSERAKEFLKALSRYAGHSLTTSAERVRVSEELLSEAAQKRAREGRINELYGMIAALKQRLALSGFDKTLMAQLSLLQSELFNLMLTI